MASLIERNGTYYLQHYVGGRIKRVSLRTDSVQIAKERLRQFESAQLTGGLNPLPTRTPIADALTAYVAHVRTMKTPKSAQTDVYYLREVFGPVCEAVTITSRRVSARARRRPAAGGGPARARPHILRTHLEELTTADVADFIAFQVRSRGLAPKTANRYREILCRLFNWAMKTGRVRMPGGTNPARAVERYREKAPEIRYLTLSQIDEQLRALEHRRQLQTMVAVYIYAGLRREEALWLTVSDVDLAAGLIRVRAKTTAAGSWQPKTRVNRAVPISTDLARYLVRYRPAATDAGWYFPSPKGSLYDPDNFSADLRAAQAEAGLRWACLDYRHTFGSQLAQKGVSLYKIAAMMGNSPEICRRHYAALVPEAMAGDVEFGRRVNGYAVPG